jgi:geranylgeranyl reductase family protein
MAASLPRATQVLVVGAGPAGSATAYFLARQGIDVVLIDKAHFPRDKTCGDGLLPNALDMLETMGVLNAVRAKAQRVDEIHSRIGAAVLHQPFAGLYPHRPYGAVLPRKQLDTLLLERARSAGAQVVTGVSAEQLPRRRVGDGWVVDLRADGHGVSLHTQWTVVCSGANRALWANQPGGGEALSALAVRAYFEGPETATDAFEIFFSDVSLPGYGWIFPTGPHTINIGAGCFPSAGRKAASARRSFQQFVASNRRVKALLDGARQLGPLKGYPIRADFPEAPLMGDGWIAAGEAAGLVSPVSGDGIDLALESGQMAAQHVSALLRTPQPERTGADYVRALHWRYGPAFRRMRWLRDWALRPVVTEWVFKVASHIHGLTGWVVRQALGVPAHLAR